MDEMMDEAENALETVNPPSQEGIPDYAQGYEIRLCVYPDGFDVKGPLPLPQEAPDEESERIPDLPEALKHLIALTREYPMDEGLGAHFDAGYEGESA